LLKERPIAELHGLAIVVRQAWFDSPPTIWGSHFGDREMRSLVVLVAMMVSTAASALPAGSHDWYTGLRSPNGVSCCNERDCRPVAYRIDPDTRREEINANSAWHPVEYDKVLPFSSPDGGYHACWSNAAGSPNFRCIILPGMASVPLSKGLA
jgi:hypothetical protein